MPERGGDKEAKRDDCHVVCLLAIAVGALKTTGKPGAESRSPPASGLVKRVAVELVSPLITSLLVRCGNYVADRNVWKIAGSV